MTFLAELWLPIVLSSVFVFFASSVLHMLLPLHKNNYKQLGGEAAVLEAMRKEGVTPGLYMFPGAASMKDAYTPEFVERCKLGPVGFMTVLPNGVPSMGKSLLQWFLYSLLVGVFAAYVAHASLPGDVSYKLVFRITGTVAFLAYGASELTNSIWKGQSWTITGKFLFDALIYALLTGGTFGWLWA